MAKIEKTFNGKRFTYLCNGEVYKNSTRDYKYACVATTRQAKGALTEGHEFILSLGNKVESTYNSMARWVNNKMLFEKISFADYEPRKGFRCETYINKL